MYKNQLGKSTSHDSDLTQLLIIGVEIYELKMQIVDNKKYQQQTTKISVCDSTK